MKTIGLIGGLSWESSAEYYRIINELVREKCGGLYSAESVMYSFNFAEIEPLQSSGEWDKLTQMMIKAAQQVERGGADLLVICANTMHKMADEVQANIHIPLLHIADATAERITNAGLHKIGLLGTRYTMDEAFYKGRLTDKYGLEVLIPNDADRLTVNSVIYDELCRGIINPASKAQYMAIMHKLVGAGAQGIILGCTEICLLVGSADCDVPLFDTTAIHAQVAVEMALK